jgi:hypothetical protein
MKGQHLRRKPPLPTVSTTVTSQQATTTTPAAPKTPLEIAQSQVGRTGSYADGGFWCARWASWVAQEAQVPGFIPRDGPSAYMPMQRPMVGLLTSQCSAGWSSSTYSDPAASATVR